MENYARPLTYIGCTLDSFISFLIIFPLMIFVILVLKLFIYSELYKDSEQCYPILYYFGQKSGCKRAVGRFAHLVNEIQRPKHDIHALSETFVSSEKDPLLGTDLQPSYTQQLQTWFRHLWYSYFNFVQSFTNQIHTYGGNIRDEFVEPALAKTFSFYPR